MHKKDARVIKGKREVITMEKQPFKDQELIRVRGMLFKAMKNDRNSQEWVLWGMPQNSIPRR